MYIISHAHTHAAEVKGMVSIAAEKVLQNLKEAVALTCKNDDRLTSALSRALFNAQKLVSLVSSSPVKGKPQSLDPEDWED